MAAALALGLAIPTPADRTPLKPGFNLFSPEQDIEVGRQVSGDADRQLPMLHNARVDNYLNKLGQRLAAHAPGNKYPYQYRCVNSAVVNAFALPGGFIYIDRGVIETADDEAQLASVLAHETAHIALRHGTSQASKTYLAEVPLYVLGGALGGTAFGGILAQLGANFALNSVFLEYSRLDESEADILGTQILYDSGYDPRAMAQFFEKIEAEEKGHNIEFFESHPNPENRVARVREEIKKLGGAPLHARTDSPEFREIKAYLHALPFPSGARRGREGVIRRPASPSPRSRHFENGVVRLDYPENWQAYGQGRSFSLAPDGGTMYDPRGNPSVAYGVIVDLYEPSKTLSGSVSLETATDQLIEKLRASNFEMNVTRHPAHMRLAGGPALSTYLASASPIGGHETDWLITTLGPDRLFYLICVAPEGDFDTYSPAFERLVDSIRFVK